MIILMIMFPCHLRNEDITSIFSQEQVVVVSLSLSLYVMNFLLPPGHQWYNRFYSFLSFRRQLTYRYTLNEEIKDYVRKGFEKNSSCDSFDYTRCFVNYHQEEIKNHQEEKVTYLISLTSFESEGWMRVNTFNKIERWRGREEEGEGEKKRRDSHR